MTLWDDEDQLVGVDGGPDVGAEAVELVAVLPQLIEQRNLDFLGVAAEGLKAHGKPISVNPGATAIAADAWRGGNDSAIAIDADHASGVTAFLCFAVVATDVKDSTPLCELVDGDEQSPTPPHPTPSHLDVVKAGTSSTRYVPASSMTT